MSVPSPSHPLAVVPIERLASVVLGKADPASIDGLGQRGLSALIAAIRTDGRSIPDTTQLEARRLATTHLVIQETARRALSCLLDAGQQPVLLKGLAMAEFYPRADLRPTGDVDLLVRRDDLGSARTALAAAGWRGVVSGPWAEDYLQREGYCWQAARPNEAVIELHHRLWGSVATDFASAVVDSAVRSGNALSSEETLRPCLEDLVVIAASHAWRQTAPRRGADFVDVALVLNSKNPFDHAKLLQRTELSAQHLPVALCLRTLGHSLPLDTRAWLVDELLPRLRGPERRLYRRTQHTDPDQLQWSKIRLAMLLAARPARLGWRALWRRVWPHPVALEVGPGRLPLWRQRMSRLFHGGGPRR